MPRGKVKTKEWKFITDLTFKWVKESYPNAGVRGIWKSKDRLNTWFKYLGMTDSEFIEGFKRSTDRLEWSKAIGVKVIGFYNDRIQKGYASNTVRAEVSTVRAFCRDNCTPLLLSRKKIAKAKAAKDEHEFTKEELSKMFYVADVRDKAVLSTAISLGFSVEDFSELPREQIESLVKKATEQKIDFIGFNFERGKTGVHSRSHLTPESRESLKVWFEYSDKKRESEGKPKSQWIWCNSNDAHLTDQALNDIIKDLVQKANVTTTGKIRFHLLRKFLMGALSDANFSDFLVKRAVGKEIPVSDSTYLQHLDKQLDEKFHEVYDYIKLVGNTNKNGLRIEELEQKVQSLEIKAEQQALENATLRRILEFAIPKENLVRAILEMQKNGLIDLSEIREPEERKTLENIKELTAPFELYLRKLPYEDLVKFVKKYSKKA